MRKTDLAVLAGMACALSASVASAQFIEGFEDYAPGSSIVGQGGWNLWNSNGNFVGNTAFVSDELAAEGSNSLRLIIESDVVQEFDIHDGQWTFRAMTYAPSIAIGDAYFIVLNTYVPSDPEKNWSIQVRFGGTDQTVESQFDGNTTPLIPDEWVELRAEVDLDADTMDIYYGGELFAAGLVYSQNVSGGGETSIEAIDLFSASMDGFHYDAVEIELVQGGDCYPDCDENLLVNLFDFFCFVSNFNAGDPYADCDDNDIINLFDFLCFVSEFNEAC